MTEPDVRRQVLGALLDKVAMERYPSTDQLNILERHLQGPEREVLVQILVEHIEADRFPSIDMINRALRLAR